MHLSRSLTVTILVVIAMAAMVTAAPPFSPMYMTICAEMHSCDTYSGPVCAIDAAGIPKTFGNACSVSLNNCLRNTNLAILRIGEC